MSGKYILLVEDNPDDVALAERALKICGMNNRLAVVSDGQQALDFLFSPGLNEKPAVVLLDMKLPLIDGLEVLRRIRADENTRLVPVIVLTASIDEKDRQESMLLGANEFQCKPLRFDDFVELMRRIRRVWLS